MWPEKLLMCLNWIIFWVIYSPQLQAHIVLNFNLSYVTLMSF